MLLQFSLETRKTGLNQTYMYSNIVRLLLELDKMKTQLEELTTVKNDDKKLLLTTVKEVREEFEKLRDELKKLEELKKEEHYITQHFNLRKAMEEIKDNLRKLRHDILQARVNVIDSLDLEEGKLVTDQDIKESEKWDKALKDLDDKVKEELSPKHKRKAEKQEEEGTSENANEEETREFTIEETRTYFQQIQEHFALNRKLLQMCVESQRTNFKEHPFDAFFDNLSIELRGVIDVLRISFIGLFKLMESFLEQENITDEVRTIISEFLSSAKEKLVEFAERQRGLPSSSRRTRINMGIDRSDLPELPPGILGMLMEIILRAENVVPGNEHVVGENKELVDRALKDFFQKKE